MADNQRVRLTKRLLKDALVSLLLQKRIEKVTIKEICETAEINRTTFYKYYQDEYALLHEIENDALLNLNDNIGNNNTTLETIIKLLTYLHDNACTFKVLFSNNANIDFPSRIFNIPKINLQIENSLKDQYTSEEIKKFTCFITNGGYALVKEWLYNEHRESVADISNIIVKIISNIIKI